MTTAIDAYPTRGNHDELLDRVDPVVYGEPTDGPLDAIQLAQYARDGFLVLDGLLTPARTRELLDEVSRLCEDPGLQDREEVVREPDGPAVRSIFAVHKLSPVFRMLAASGGMAGVARQILGGVVAVHQSRINLKPGFAGKAFPWHSDFETWHAEDGMPRMRALSISVCLTDNHPYNGPLMLVPGSHRRFVACAGATPDDHYKQSLRKQAYGVPNQDALTRLCHEAGGIAQPTPKAGSAIVFDCNTMHGSAGNITPYPRTNAFFVFNHVDNALEEPFAGTTPRPPFIADRQPEPTSQWSL